MNILFDLDGTLTDPREGIVACMKHALSALGRTIPDDAEFARFIGPPLRASFGKLLSCAENDADVDAAISAYRDRFAARGMFENGVYEGIPQALRALSVDGARLFVATSKPRVFAEKILEHFGLMAHFTAVYGSELDGALSDKAELIAHALKTSSLSPNNTAMIGDRRYDVLGARANGVGAIGVLWGYGSREELVAAGAEALCERPSDLERMLTPDFDALRI